MRIYDRRLTKMLDSLLNDRQKALLEVNNIEVIYNHVILVLKGVSLSVPKGGIVCLVGWQWRWQNDDLESHFRPAEI